MKRHILSKSFAFYCGVLMLFATAALAADSPNPFLGYWALTIPGGGAGWLGLTEKDGKLSAAILWGGGSVTPWASAKVEGDKLIVSHPVRNATETITATIDKADKDNLVLSIAQQRGTAPATGQKAFTGKRIPPVPPAPDLAKVKFGKPIKLMNGQNLDGWKIIEKGAASGWTVKDGVLTNNPAQVQGQPHKNYGNLRTEKEFEDFNLKLETNVPKDSNSGIYLRGIYEIQVFDSYGKPLDPHNMGALYSRITPSEAAEKPAGEWQTFDITLVDRHITVILNGKKIIDNQPVLGCTGGALWSDQFKPGPIYLQGDHSGANYRNIILTPVVK